MPRFQPALTIFIFLSLSACAHAPMASEARATAPTSPEAGGQRTICTQKNDTRFLEVKPKTDGSFDLLYTKFGTEKAVATGAKSYCQEVVQTIKTKLKASGFSCE